MYSSTRRLFFVIGLLALAAAYVPSAAHAAPPPPPPAATFQVLEAGAGRLVATTGCGVFEQPAGEAEWTKIPGLDQRASDIVAMGNGLLAIAGVSDAQGNYVPALFRRESGGSWQRLAEAPANPANLAANLSGSRVYLRTGFGPSQLWRSEDGGRTWRQIYQTQGQDVILDVAAAGAFSGGQDMVVAVTRGGQDTPQRVVVSLDSGATWRTVPGETINVNDARLFVSYESDTVYVASSGRDGMRLVRVRDRSERLETVTLPEGWNGLPYPLNALAAFRSSIVLAINVATNQSTAIGTQQGSSRNYSSFDQGIGGISDLAYQRLANQGEPVPLLLAATDNGIYQRFADAPGWARLQAQPVGCAVTAPPPPAGDPFAPVPRQPNTNERLYFAETQHTLSHEFKRFWEQHGGLPIFGYPRSEEFPEPNADLNRVFTTQYLERERFEFHPENNPPYRVLLGRLGNELLKRQRRDWRAEDDLSNPLPGTTCRRFEVGGEQRQICGSFLQYWQTRGLNMDGREGTSYEESLALFGLPLTGVRMEKNNAGDTVLTQWFERARFEWHPNNPEPYKVLLGLLGNEITAR